MTVEERPFQGRDRAQTNDGPSGPVASLGLKPKIRHRRYAGLKAPRFRGGATVFLDWMLLGELTPVEI
jgi:hypothetical protein